jgi:hypothetical protein
LFCFNIIYRIANHSFHDREKRTKGKHLF